MKQRANFRIKKAVASEPLITVANLGRIFPKDEEEEQVSVGEISRGNLRCLFRLYKIVRFFYAVVYFYFFPMFVMFIPFLVIIFSSRVHTSQVISSLKEDS